MDNPQPEPTKSHSFGDSLAILALVISLLTWAFAPTIIGKALAVAASVAILVYMAYKSHFTRNLSQTQQHIIAGLLAAVLILFATFQLRAEWKAAHTDLIAKSPVPAPQPQSPPPPSAIPQTSLPEYAPAHKTEKKSQVKSPAPSKPRSSPDRDAPQGSGNTVVGQVPFVPNGDNNTFVGPTDNHGNVIIPPGTAIGAGAQADKTSVAIGAGAGAGQTSIRQGGNGDCQANAIGGSAIVGANCGKPNPNDSVIFYNCGGNPRRVSEGGSRIELLLIAPTLEWDKQTEQIMSGGQADQLLSHAQQGIQDFPDWLTPYLYAAWADAKLENTDGAQEMFSHFDKQKGENYEDDPCKSMASVLRSWLTAHSKPQ